MRHRFAVIAITLLAACTCASPPRAYAFHAEPLAPEGWYHDAQRQMERCLHKLGFKIMNHSYDDIEWLMTRPGVMGPAGELPDSGTIIGQWDAPNRIYLDARFVHSPIVIRHEVGHWMTQLGDSIHDDPRFLTCVAEAAP